MEERASGFRFVAERQLGRDSLVGAWTTVTLLSVDDVLSSVGA